MRWTVLAGAAAAMALLTPSAPLQADDLDVWANKIDGAGKPTDMTLLYDQNGDIFVTASGLEQCDEKRIMVRGIDRQGAISDTFAYEFADTFVAAHLSGRNVVLFGRQDPGSKICFAYRMEIGPD